MTHSPNSDNQRDPNSNRRLWLLLLTRTSIALGVILLVGIAGGAWWAWIFIHERLAPLVEKNVGQLLGRPIELGEVERFSFNSLRFGSLSVPATPTDPDRVVAEAVEVEFDLKQLLLNRTLELNVTLVQPDVYAEQAKDGTWVSTQIQPSDETGFIRIELETIGIQNADVVLVPHSEPGKPKEVSVVFDQVSGIARLLDQNQRIRYNLNGEAASGGNFSLAGETRFPALQTTLKLQGDDFLAADVSRLVELPLNLQAGRVDANLKLQLESNQVSGVFGTVDLNKVTAKAPQLPQAFNNAQGTLRFQGMQVQLNNVQTSFGKIPLVANGVIDTKTGYNISARLQPVSLASAQQTLNIQVPVTTAGQAVGNLKVTGPILEPTLSGTVVSTRPARIDRVNFSNFRTDFTFSTADSEITFKNIQATPTVGGKITGAGVIDFPEAKPGTQLSAGDFDLDFDFVARNVPGDALARAYGASPAIAIGDVSASADISGSVDNLRTEVQLKAPEATYPGTAEVVVTTKDRNILIQDAELNVAGGTVNARGQFSQGGQFQAFVDATGVQLNKFSPQLRGQLSADLRLEGTSFEPSDIQAQGQVGFSEGLAVVSQPLTAQFRWNGQVIQVEQATAPGLSAEGTIAIRLEGKQAPEITGLNLDVQAQDYNLQELASNLPGSNNIKLGGQVDFTGQVTGTPTAPNAVGDIRLQNLAVNGLAFDPVLIGNLNFQAGQRTEFQATGVQDRIAVTLGPNYLPTSFFIRRDQAVATGRTQGETLLVDVQRFPLALVQSFIPPGATANLGPVAGELSGNLAINIADNLLESTAIGEVAIAQPQIGRITADQFRARFSYDQGAATLSAGELQLGKSRIFLSGNLQPGPDRRFQFQINFDQARIENILQGFGLFDFQDITGGLQRPELAGAEALQLVPVGLPDAPLISQLRRFEEIQTLLEQARAQREASPLPTLAELNGTISGKITGTGALQPSLQQTLNVSFNVLGQDWEWGDYTIEEAIAQGSYNNSVLTLVPVRIDLGEAFLALRGQFAQEQLSGQVRVESLPVELVKPFLPQLPVQVEGNLNSLVTLAGSLKNPTAIGEIALVEGVLNGEPVESAFASFSYDNARLNFGGTALAVGTEAVEITGSVPVPLPFASVQPDSNQISVNVNVEDEGLALLNLFTNQVTWVEGQGQVDVDVQGTLNQPIILGNVSVNNATLKAQALAEPLTNVTGTVEFNGNRINVQDIQAQYNGEQLTASGILPIFASQQAQQQAATNPLTVSLNDLEELELQGLYQGGVSGNVVITGTALEPEIGGEIRLMNGQILAGQIAAQRLGVGGGQTPAQAPGAGGQTPAQAPGAGGQTPAQAPGAGGQTPAQSPGAGGQTQTSFPIEFEDLQLILGEDVRVTLQPILSVDAMGDVTINGTLANPRPQGVIRLEDGEVNLFTTQFTLDRGYQQTVQFTPEQGFDPIVDLRLVAAVPEGTGTRIPTTSLSSEVLDVPTTDLGTFETVRVQARVTGPASELAQNLELTSEPSRSQEEIVALLGGSFVNSLGQGDPLLGLANVAGSALLSPFQGTITQLGEAIGLSELRLYPTTVTDPGSETSTLGLATEAVVEVAGNFSVSASQVFASDEPLRYNLLYRISDQVLVRGSTNLSDESRALVEYEQRF